MREDALYAIAADLQGANRNRQRLRNNMARRLPEEFRGKEPVPLCLALNLDEARKIESVLDRNSIDYTFEITPITESNVLMILFASAKDGVMFLVTSEQYESCIRLLNEAGLSSLISER